MRERVTRTWFYEGVFEGLNQSLKRRILFEWVTAVLFCSKDAFSPMVGNSLMDHLQGLIMFDSANGEVTRVRAESNQKGAWWLRLKLVESLIFVDVTKEPRGFDQVESFDKKMIVFF